MSLETFNPFGISTVYVIVYSPAASGVNSPFANSVPLTETFTNDVKSKPFVVAAVIPSRTLTVSFSMIKLIC